MLELYTHPMSPCAQKVRIVLAEKQLPWTAHYVDLPEKENLKPAYLKLNPLGVVPTLVQDGRPVIESSIICEFLEDSFPEVPLRPADPYEIQKMRFWMKHVDIKLHPACGTLQWPMVMREKLMEKTEQQRNALLEQIPEKPRRERQKRLVKFGLDAPDVADAVQTYRKTVLDMEKALADHAWLVSDNFTLADICVVPYFQTLYQFGWTSIYETDCPGVTDWVARCRSRASYKSGVSDDFSDQLIMELQHKGAQVWDKISNHLS